MRNRIIVIFLLFTTIILGQNLNITLQTEKTEYLQYEPIYILVEIKNVGNNKVTIPSFSRYSRNAEIMVFNQNRERIEPYEEADIIGVMTKYYDLKPGEGLFFTTNLLNNGNRHNKNNVTYYGFYFEPDSYTIEIKYNYIDIFSEKKQKEVEFISNKQTITITKPAREDEEGIITDLKTVAKKRKEKEFSESIKKAIAIIQKYPLHPLTQQAYLYLNHSSMKYYNFDRGKYLKNYILDFPHSYRAMNMARKYMEQDDKFKEEIIYSKYYKKIIEFKKNDEFKRSILDRSPYNKELLRKMSEKNIKNNEAIK